jgi:N-methylhydantoinase B/oxoprolinase/acetone carboxylase alpha subunit
VDVFAPAWALYADTLDTEMIESRGAVMYLYRRLSRDSHGFGRNRGGASPDHALIMHDGKTGAAALIGSSMGFGGKFPQPGGLFGGYAPGCFPGCVIQGSDVLDTMKNGGQLPKSSRDLLSNRTIKGDYQVQKPERANFVCAEGDIVVRAAAGGGGYGDALERTPERVLADVQRGVLSVEAARRVYGVIIAGGSVLRIDVDATDAERVAVREARRSKSLPFEAFTAEWSQRRPSDEALVHYGPWPL